ncbi:HpcH/HpaI aldolase/citrate lyase family protein [Glacieibacterium frigidum]|uniref:CoA ester lyase n=1 Tax=Glacieibacterium frigidum TaxID=2593303 RepID=A0A552UF20_9SPHN|nr:CoA ester lyase [Glacieibacterium frigidum]TRW16815.1 CoA ester lyase [Glacieibacterium frigidum]
MRSKLFVPAARPEFFTKALAGDADALSFDLEDSVPAGAKAAARARLAELLASDAVRGSAKTIIVRVNGLDTPDFAEDVAALRGARVDLINLPKCEDAAVIQAAAEAVGDTRLLPTLETPRALARAAEIAAHPAVAGLQVGLNDLFATLGIDRRNVAHVHAALWTIRMAAGEGGCVAIDGAWPNIDDADGFRAEAELARSMGYVGKSCVHPSQVALANAVFGNDAATLDRARRIIAAGDSAAATGRGAFTLDGEMIDRPAIEQARTLLAGGKAL